MTSEQDVVVRCVGCGVQRIASVDPCGTCAEIAGYCPTCRWNQVLDSRHEVCRECSTRLVPGYGDTR